jgi:hypothetical protein
METARTGNVVPRSRKRKEKYRQFFPDPAAGSPKIYIILGHHRRMCRKNLQLKREIRIRDKNAGKIGNNQKNLWQL